MFVTLRSNGVDLPVTGWAVELSGDDVILSSGVEALTGTAQKIVAKSGRSGGGFRSGSSERGYHFKAFRVERSQDSGSAILGGKQGSMEESSPVQPREQRCRSPRDCNEAGLFEQSCAACQGPERTRRASRRRRLRGRRGGDRRRGRSCSLLGPGPEPKSNEAQRSEEGQRFGRRAQGAPPGEPGLGRRHQRTSSRSTS